MRRVISYTLKCGNEHTFDSWFKSAEAFDALRGGGHLTCPVCGSARVRKSLMAPNVTASKAKERPLTETRTPESKLEAALAEFRRNVEESSEYVGERFAEEARAIHDGEAPERAIYGEARPEDARKLNEEGIAVAPLPFTPRSKVN